MHPGLHRYPMPSPGPFVKAILIAAQDGIPIKFSPLTLELDSDPDDVESWMFFVSDLTPALHAIFLKAHFWLLAIIQGVVFPTKSKRSSFLLNIKGIDLTHTGMVKTARLAWVVLEAFYDVTTAYGAARRTSLQEAAIRILKSLRAFDCTIQFPSGIASLQFRMFAELEDMEEALFLRLRAVLAPIVINDNYGGRGHNWDWDCTIGFADSHPADACGACEIAEWFVYYEHKKPHCCPARSTDADLAHTL
ncbi:hypothetical protein AURDEDRAFT_175845 [Auricularia subglabra TFB-10046 SS5]|nr:hypothetical protein AURDEDRAFT_175845 [Auricularia subglabra TFB-10046 SS5]